ncbi:MAG: glycosidase [candidate division KSB1 bacterium]
MQKRFVFALFFGGLLASAAFGQNNPSPQPSRPRVRLPIFAFDSFQPEALLAPQGSGWEAQSVSAPAALVKQDTLFLFYAAEDRVRLGGLNGTARIGLAYRTEGLHFTRLSEPVLTPTLDIETPGGCTNPNVVLADSVFYMTYSAFDGKTARLALATSRDLRHWKKHGLIFSDTGATAGGVMLSQKINGRFVMYYGKEEIRIAYSNDLRHWFPQAEPLLRARADKFDSERLAVGPAAMIIDSTIVLLYNAEDASGRRALGLARFSLNNPATVLARWDSPLFAPPSSETRNEQKFRVSSLVWWRGQYELFYSGPAKHIGRVKGRLLFTEGK